MFSKTRELRGLSLPGITELENSGDIVCGRTPRGLSCVGSSEPGIASSKAFVPFTLVDSVRAVVNRAWHGCAIDSVGGARCWGFNEAGQLGNGEHTAPKVFADVYEPVEVRGVSDIAQLALGSAHTCARIVSGAVYCWGRADRGQSGLSVSVEDHEDANPVLDLTDAIDVAAMDAWTCAVRRTGKVVCWGQPSHDRADMTPKEVPGLTGAIQIVLFATHGHQGACALRDDGTIACFHGTAAPPHLLDARDVTQLAAGTEHMCALRRDGKVTCYGADGAGQRGIEDAEGLGNEVPGLEHVAQIAAGASFTCARHAP